MYRNVDFRTRRRIGPLQVHYRHSISMDLVFALTYNLRSGVRKANRLKVEECVRRKLAAIQVADVAA